MWKQYDIIYLENNKNKNHIFGLFSALLNLLWTIWEKINNGIFSSKMFPTALTGISQIYFNPNPNIIEAENQ